MAPEMITNSRCTEKVDLFSMGILLWEICTGAFVQLRLRVMQGAATCAAVATGASYRPAAMFPHALLAGERPRRGDMRLPKVPKECPQVGGILHGAWRTLAQRNLGRQANPSSVCAACSKEHEMLSRFLPFARFAGGGRPDLPVHEPGPLGAAHSPAADAAATRPAQAQWAQRPQWGRALHRSSSSSKWPQQAATCFACSSRCHCRWGGLPCRAGGPVTFQAASGTSTA